MTAISSVPFGSTKSLAILSWLLLSGDAASFPAQQKPDAKISQDECDDLLALANSNHVVMRGLEAFRQVAGDDGCADWAATALAAEQARIDNAVSFLRRICETFEAEGY